MGNIHLRVSLRRLLCTCAALRCCLTSVGRMRDVPTKTEHPRAAKSWISPSILWDIWEESTCFDGTKKGFLSFLLVYLRIYTFEDRCVILEEVTVTKKSGKCWIHQPAPIRFDVLRGLVFSRCLPWLPYTSNGSGGSLYHPCLVKLEMVCYVGLPHSFWLFVTVRHGIDGPFIDGLPINSMVNFHGEL